MRFAVIRGRICSDLRVLEPPQLYRILCFRKMYKKEKNETPRCGKEGSLLAISRLARDYCRLNTTSGPRLDNPSPTELPAALYLLCKSFSCEPARRRGETRAAMGKNPILSKWISPSKKTQKKTTPPPTEQLHHLQRQSNKTIKSEPEK